MKTSNTISQMRKGLLEMCILSIISRGEAYPSDVITELKDKDMMVVEGTIYPLLNRMLREDYLTYKWRESTSGPPRKYYSITDLGKTFLTDLQKHWTGLADSINKVLNHQQ